VDEERAGIFDNKDSAPGDLGACKEGDVSGGRRMERFETKVRMSKLMAKGKNFVASVASAAGFKNRE
jgi:hypothetical protein